jgi:hypothetical protein
VAKKSGDTAMMLNQLILARGYVLAPMLPAADNAGKSKTKTTKSLRATVMDVFKRCFSVSRR